MSNYKIRVNGEAESKEVQELFFELGGKWCAGGCDIKYTDEPYFYLENGLVLYGYSAETFITEKHKEITLPELRDLVVLKRNDVGDANAFRHDNGVKYYITSDNKYYYFSNIPTFQWTESCNDIDYLEKRVKPIEKPMKEYLRKNSDDTYSYIGTAQPDHVSNFMIEIPEGATYYAKDASLGKSGNFFFRLRSDDFDFEAVWLESNWIQAIFNVENQDVLWQRNNNQTIASAVESSHPEELPFIDDEPKVETATGYQLDVVGSNTYGSRSRYDGESDISYRQHLMNFIVGNRTESINDQYAEIEKVRQSAWQKQEGGSHYKNLKIQPMQYALENKLDYAQANVVKYVTRHKEKNGKEDLLKAIHNLELMIEFYYGDEK